MALLALANCDARRSAAAARSQQAGPSISFAAIESPSMQFLPRQEEVPGWRLSDDPLVYPGDKLIRYLHQDARHFREYEVIDLTVGEYDRVGADGAAIVEIFRFPDFVKAFGAYSTRRKPGAIPFEVANEGFLGPNSIHIWCGPFYVRLLGAGQSHLAEPLKQLARAITTTMPPAPGKPAVFKFFPESQRLPNSETYDARAAFGQPYLVNAFTARFQVDGSEVDGLILPATNKQQATQILQRFETFYRSNGRVLDPIPNLGEGNFTAEDRFVGRAVAFRLDRFVIAFRGYVLRQQLVDLAIAADQRILGTIRRQLEEADEAAEQAAETAAGRPQ